ncbi:hypothetical protein ACFV29_22220 [Streptomyces sp. NPDC059690]|uniref:hypothetical protein n=1 Tax=Streptomyces sp. NPDC059690 TaxID=3346907 RepID=UPI003682D89C
MTAHDDVTPPAAEEEATRALAPAGGEEATRALVPAGGEEATRALIPPGGEEATRALAPTDARAATLHLDSIGERTLSDDAAGADDPVDADADYSATVLASHWIQRPELDRTLVEETAENVPSVRPDRVDGTVLRFGPGVTAAVEHRLHRTLAPASPPPPPRTRWRRLRRHALPTLVVLAVLAFLLWQRSAPSVQVSGVAVTVRPAVLGCDDTADVVGLVTTNGRAGTISYRWVRSDGTASGVLREVTVRGQKTARLHLRWTYRGKGHRGAQAELRILSPAHRESTARFTYDCS